jgi:hypothetical protein
LPFGKKPITTRWVYKVLNDSSGKPSKFKARLMARGCEQKEGLYFQETFALVIKWITILFMIALVAHYGWKISQMDMKTVFLNGDFHDKVCMMQPKGFTQPGKKHLVCKLNKALYGL